MSPNKLKIFLLVAPTLQDCFLTLICLRVNYNCKTSFASVIIIIYAQWQNIFFLSLLLSDPFKGLMDQNVGLWEGGAVLKTER